MCFFVGKERPAPLCKALMSRAKGGKHVVILSCRVRYCDKGVDDVFFRESVSGHCLVPSRQYQRQASDTCVVPLEDVAPEKWSNGCPVGKSELRADKHAQVSNYRVRRYAAMGWL